MKRVGFALLLILLLTAQTTPAEPELRLLTHNLHSETRFLDPMVAVIRDADADVVALQECTLAAYERFEAEFAEEYPYRYASVAGQRFSSLALLSRYEILEEETLPVEQMRLLRVVLDVAGRPVTVFNAHPANPGLAQYDSEPRHEDLLFLLEQTALESNPVIVMGDFNTQEFSEDYDLVAAQFIDSFRELHPEDLGATFPDYSQPQALVNAWLPRWTPPILRIDYVWHDASFAAQEVYVWPESSGSDHRALFARLRLIDTTQ
jgi:endonuclease/exonuclease/phosphatase family metal-dependent hydrolase